LADKTQPADDFPADDQGYGYDNIADVLSMSPLLFEKIDRAAERLIDAALAIPMAAFETLYWEAEVLEGTVGAANALGWNLWSNGELPTTFEAPDDGVYVVTAYVEGHQAGPALVQMGLRFDTEEVLLQVASIAGSAAMYQAAFGATAGTHEIAASFKNDFYDPDNSLDRNLIIDWLRVEGPYQAGTALHRVEGETLPVGSDAGNGFQRIATGDPATAVLTLSATGTYRLQAHVYGATEDDTKPQMAWVVDGNLLADPKTIKHTEAERVMMTQDVSLTAGDHTIGVQLINPAAESICALYVDWFTVLGATDLNVDPNPVREVLLTCSPETMDAAACTEEILGSFGRRAWRRPLNSTELTRLSALATNARTLTESFDEGIRFGMQALLLSPHFLYRVELDPALGTGEPHPLTHHELATRMSYALWSTIPDAELNTLADEGTLHEPATLEAQVRRMLLDPKTAALTDNFAGQWLQLRNMSNIVRDSVLFPEFTEALAQSMREETERVFEWFLQSSDTNVLDMMTSETTSVDATLATFYGLPGHSGEGVEWMTGAEQNRFGILSHASILSITSHTFGTSPVNRGKWVLGQLLCMEPPPPPAEINTQLVVDENQPMSMRDRLAQHRADPMCAGCHNLMDPIGLALENFDAIGRWRTTDDYGFPVDPAGELVDGTPFVSPQELAVVIRDHHALPHCMVEQLFTYVLGRGFDASDSCVLDDLAQEWEGDGYVLDELIVRLLTSPTFTQRTPPDVPTPEEE